MAEIRNDPRVGHAPSTPEEALSWLNRLAHGEPGLHLVSLRAAVGFVRRDLAALRLALATAERERDSESRWAKEYLDKATAAMAQRDSAWREVESLREWKEKAEAERAAAVARLNRIDCYAGERCEASGCRPDPCGPVEYADVEGVPLCAECWQECCDDAATEKGAPE